MRPKHIYIYIHTYTSYYLNTTLRKTAYIHIYQDKYIPQAILFCSRSSSGHTRSLAASIIAIKIGTLPETETPQSKDIDPGEFPKQSNCTGTNKNPYKNSLLPKLGGTERDLTNDKQACRGLRRALHRAMRVCVNVNQTHHLAIPRHKNIAQVVKIKT